MYSANDGRSRGCCSTRDASPCGSAADRCGPLSCGDASTRESHVHAARRRAVAGTRSWSSRTPRGACRSTAAHAQRPLRRPAPPSFVRDTPRGGGAGYRSSRSGGQDNDASTTSVASWPGTAAPPPTPCSGATCGNTSLRSSRRSVGPSAHCPDVRALNCAARSARRRVLIARLHSGWNTATVLPSGSLNQADRPMPAVVTMWSTVLKVSVSYSSNSTPFAARAATSLSMSSDQKRTWV
jgi:hypothetical protein